MALVQELKKKLNQSSRATYLKSLLLLILAAWTAFSQTAVAGRGLDLVQELEENATELANLKRVRLDLPTSSLVKSESEQKQVLRDLSHSIYVVESWDRILNEQLHASQRRAIAEMSSGSINDCESADLDPTGVLNSYVPDTVAALAAPAANAINAPILITEELRNAFFEKMKEALEKGLFFDGDDFFRLVYFIESNQSKWIGKEGSLSYPGELFEVKLNKKFKDIKIYYTKENKIYLGFLDSRLGTGGTKTTFSIFDYTNSFESYAGQIPRDTESEKIKREFRRDSRIYREFSQLRSADTTYFPRIEYIGPGIIILERATVDLSKVEPSNYRREPKLNTLLEVAKGSRVMHRTMKRNHGDFKPENIFLMPRGAVLADPGFSNKIEAVSKPRNNFLTPDYAAPEQLVALIQTLSRQGSIPEGMEDSEIFRHYSSLFDKLGWIGDTQAEKERNLLAVDIPAIALVILEYMQPNHPIAKAYDSDIAKKFEEQSADPKIDLGLLSSKFRLQIYTQFRDQFKTSNIFIPEEALLFAASESLNRRINIDQVIAALTYLVKKEEKGPPRHTSADPKSVLQTYRVNDIVDAPSEAVNRALEREPVGTYVIRLNRFGRAIRPKANLAIHWRTEDGVIEKVLDHINPLESSSLDAEVAFLRNLNFLRLPLGVNLRKSLASAAAAPPKGRTRPLRAGQNFPWRHTKTHRLPPL